MDQTFFLLLNYQCTGKKILCISHHLYIYVFKSEASNTSLNPPDIFLLSPSESTFAHSKLNTNFIFIFCLIVLKK